MHSQSKTERLWFSHLLESSTIPVAVDKQLKQRIHGLLARSEVFDNFLQLKFPNLKRVRLKHLCSSQFFAYYLLHSTRWKVENRCFQL